MRLGSQQVAYIDIDTDGGQPFHSITEIGVVYGEQKIRFPVYGSLNKDGLKQFLAWLQKIPDVVLVAHNAKNSDVINFLRNLDKFNIPIPVGLKFADSMDLIRRLKTLGKCESIQIYQ